MFSVERLSQLLLAILLCAWVVIALVGRNKGVVDVKVNVDSISMPDSISKVYVVRDSVRSKKAGTKSATAHGKSNKSNKSKNSNKSNKQKPKVNKRDHLHEPVRPLE